MPTGFSFIIPTYHQARILKTTVLKLSELEYTRQRYEVIVISNDPQDQETARVVKQLQKRMSNLQFGVEPQRGASPARNHGVKLARFRHLIFFDDDLRFSPKLLQAYDRTWKKYPQARIISPQSFPVHEHDRPLTAAEQRLVNTSPWCFGLLDRGQQDKLLELGELAYAGNMSYRLSPGQKTVSHPYLGVPLYGLGRIGAEDYELSTRTLLQHEQIVYVADPELSIENVIAAPRYTTEYISRRHFMGGIELAMMERYIEAQFPEYQSFYTRYLRSWSGLWLLLRNKYERLMFFSYWFNKRYFPSPLKRAQPE